MKHNERSGDVLLRIAGMHLSGRELSVFIAWFIDKDGFNPTVELIATRVGIRPSNVSAVLKTLQDKQVLRVIARGRRNMPIMDLGGAFHHMTATVVGSNRDLNTIADGSSEVTYTTEIGSSQGTTATRDGSNEASNTTEAGSIKSRLLPNTVTTTTVVGSPTQNNPEVDLEVEVDPPKVVDAPDVTKAVVGDLCRVIRSNKGLWAKPLFEAARDWANGKGTVNWSAVISSVSTLVASKNRGLVRDKITEGRTEGEAMAAADQVERPRSTVPAESSSVDLAQQQAEQELRRIFSDPRYIDRCASKGIYSSEPGEGTNG